MQRRMFSPKIVDSDAFLDMSTSAQNLYFHLGMRADDDGFVGNPKKILRMIGGNDDDLKILIAKRFILIFEGGIIVIKHWRINNLIRKDWHKKTVYIDEKKQLELKENGSYTKLVNENATIRQHSIDKISLVKNNYSAPTMHDTDFNSFWSIYPKRKGKALAEKIFMKLDTALLPKILESVEKEKLTPQWQDIKYIPFPSTWLNQKRWEDEEDNLTPEQEAKKMVKEFGANTASFRFEKKYGNAEYLKHISILNN